MRKVAVSQEVLEGSRRVAANIYHVDEDLMSDLRILYKKYGVRLMSRAARQMRFELRVQRNARKLN